jgi:ATP-dependent DNA helicase PIF1
MRQKQALSVMVSGRSVFLTGPPGAGKTYVLHHFIKRAEQAGKKVAVTASTGIAASHIAGTTIHSWSGLGIMDDLTSEDLERLSSNERLLKRYNGTDILVIDEISMLHGKRLDMINQLAKVLRGNEQPFGGLQVILVGDLFQLPPISRNSYELDLAHLSAAWQDLDLAICYLTEQHRQAESDELLAVLVAMRQGELDVMHQEIIQSRLRITPTDGQTVTRLYTHNVDVEAINQRYLTALPSAARCYHMQSKGSKAKLEQLTKNLLASETLELKIGAEVMFVANNFGEGYVNGTRGTVLELGIGGPTVKLLNGRKIVVEPHTWSLNEDGRVRAEASQLPLRLAWAITIHKSQGMSLDAAEVDLSKAFTPGMGYVALSRVRSLNGLFVLGLNAMALNMQPQMFEFDRQLQLASAALAVHVDDIAPVVHPASGQPVRVESANPALLSALKTWRTQRASHDSVPAYIIAHNTTLEALARLAPQTQQQLLVVPGFGSKKAANYGEEILAIIQSAA